MLQRYLAHRVMSGVICPAHPVLARLDLGRLQEEPAGCGCAEVEVEGSVRADGDARGNWDTGFDVGGACVEFLLA